jgi:AcrR family transcriptional regulator
MVAAVTQPTARRRAAALPADERRRRLVDATTPLVLEYGTALTTRQIAEAAGVAEGTIFRVFPDKESLLREVLAVALDPAPFDQAVEAIDLDLDLQQRLEIAVRLLQDRVTRVGRLATASGVAKPRGPRTLAATMDTLAPLFEPDATGLRRQPRDCARMLASMTIAATHPALVVGDPMPPEEIVALFLHGVLDPTDPEDPTC